MQLLASASLSCPALAWLGHEAASGDYPTSRLPRERERELSFDFYLRLQSLLSHKLIRVVIVVVVVVVVFRGGTYSTVLTLLRLWVAP